MYWSVTATSAMFVMSQLFALDEVEQQIERPLERRQRQLMPLGLVHDHRG